MQAVLKVGTNRSPGTHNQLGRWYEIRVCTLKACFSNFIFMFFMGHISSAQNLLLILSSGIFLVVLKRPCIVSEVKSKLAVVKENL